jgi:hypothetical protein
MHNIHDIKSICNQNVFIKYSVKGNTWTTNFKIINQNKNDMCDVKSL